MESETVLNLAKALILTIPLFLLASCGGGGGSNSVEDFSPTPQSPDFLSISGSVQGLTGVLIIGWGDRTQVITGDSIDIPLAFESGESFELTVVSQPTSQLCTIDSPVQFSNQDADIVGVQITCIVQNIIRVSVVNFFTGEAMLGVDVTATWNDAGAQETLSGVSDNQGQVSFVVPTFDGRIVVNADPVGFGEQSKVVQNTNIPAGRIARMLMQPMILGTTFDSAAGTDLTVGGEVLISLPADALIDANGDAYNGTVTAELTVVDPSVDLEIMPGDYLSRDLAGSTAPIESFGALSLTLTGDNGEVLDLAVGQVADINIPVAEAARASAPAVSPLYHYDPISGYWTEEGVATRTTLPTGLLAYQGQVSHFTTWNADQEYSPVLLSGCVETLSGEPFGNVRVEAAGATYLGTSFAVTDSSGMFSVPVKPDSNVLITAGDGLQSSTAQVSMGSADQGLADCLVASAGSSTINLTWGENPSDLDTRLYGFSSLNSNDDFQVNFTNRAATVNNITVNLDVDDVNSFGPEVTTFPDFPFPGVYRYAVHLFTGVSSIQESPARVELNLRGQVSVFTPPSGTPTDCWAVLDLVVDDAGNVTVTPIGSWEPEGYCTNNEFPNPTGANNPAPLEADSIAAPSNPLTKSIARKYYAPQAE